MNEPNYTVEVSVLTRVVLTLTEELDPDSVQPGTVTLMQGEELVDAALSVAGKQVTLVPKRQLAAGTAYEVRTTKALRSAAGRAVQSEFRREFVTEYLPLRTVLHHPTGYATSGGALVLGDFNGDTRTDVALTQANPARVGLYLATDDGGLAPPVYLPLSRPHCFPSAIQAEDLNADGRMDFVVGAWISGNNQNGGCGLDVLLQAPSGQFTQGAQLVSSRVQELALADMNGDGTRDVVGVGGAEEEDRIVRCAIAVWLPREDGTLQPPTEYPLLPGGRYEMHVTDLNGDAREDIVVWTSHTATSQAVYFQRPSGGIGEPTVLEPARLPDTQTTSWTGATSLDFTGDGLPDLVTTAGGNSVIVYVNDPQGTFGQQLGYRAYNLPYAPVAADFDGNGTQDLLILHHGWHAVGVYLPRSAEDVTLLNRYLLDYANVPSEGVAVGDLNGDGRPDIALSEPRGLVVLYQLPRQ